MFIVIGFTFDIKDDLLPLGEKQSKMIRGKNKTKLGFDWGKREGQETDLDVRNKWYSRNILLAIPKNRPFETLCYAEYPTKALRYLKDEVNPSSPQLKAYLTTIMHKYGPDSYKRGDKENLPILINFLLALNDTELTMLFINKVLAAKQYSFQVYGLQMGHEELVSKLLLTIPWKDLKEIIECTIENGDSNDYIRWLEVYKCTGIIDIAHKAIEMCFKEAQESKGNHYSIYSSYSSSCTWDPIFQLLCDNEELCERWMEPLLDCEKVMSTIELVTKLASQVLSTNQSIYLKSRILSHFITRVKDIKKLCNPSSCYNNSFDHLPDGFPTYGNGYAKMIFVVIKAALNTFANFKAELQELCNYLVESENSQR